MNVVQDANQRSQEQFEATVITGDGTHETRRVRALAAKFDHERELYFPFDNTKTGIRMMGSKQRMSEQAERKSLRALDIVRDHKGRNARKFFFMMDKEHIDGDVCDALADKFDTLSTSYSEVEQLDDCAHRCEFDIGSADLTVFSVIIGDEFECFEERLAELVRVKCGHEIDARDRDELKREIDNVLDDNSGAALIEDASRTELQIAFPSVCTVLSAFEDEPA